MPRWRPPAPRSSPYITAAGLGRLQAELKTLWRRRAEVTEALAAAAAEGDRSENAEYIYRKKQLRELDRRIRYLQKRIPELKPVGETPSDTGRVFFGAWVTLEDETGERRTYRIVGPDEIDTARGWISMDAPLARALMKKAVAEEVTVQAPGGAATYCITGIEYRD